MQKIEISGQEHPVAFTAFTLYIYDEGGHGLIMADYPKIVNDFQRTGAFSLATVSKLLYCAVATGYYLAGKEMPQDLKPHDFIDPLVEDTDLAAQVVNGISANIMSKKKTEKAPIQAGKLAG